MQTGVDVAIKQSVATLAALERVVTVLQDNIASRLVEIQTDMGL